MRIAITGSSGMIGQALVRRLEAMGHTVLRLVRRNPRSGEVRWDPARGTLDPMALKGVEGAINLAGENIATRWTEESRRRIRESRIRSTTVLAETMARMDARPRVLISVSAVGFYGDQGDTELTEESTAGSGFLPTLAQEWERSAQPASAAGIRVVHPRLGIVLSPEGGALARMLPPFKLGLGGKLGSGDQWMSWVALDDVTAALAFLLEQPLSGPVNLVAPQPVTNREFTRTLGQVLSRPAVFTVPPFALHLAYGRDMPDEALLSSTRVRPAKLEHAGFRFRHPQLREALASLLA
jgi:uncharacterized protein